MIEDNEIASMAADMEQAYGLQSAVARATDRALEALDHGHVRVATTWHRILNTLNRAREPPSADHPSHNDAGTKRQVKTTDSP